MIIKELGHPIMSVSLPMEADVEYYTDPEMIHDAFENLVDMVVDGGIGGTIPSTIIDCSSGAPELIREGAGAWEEEEN
jgi:tRNA A37 threonylcarbamoyladenosine synthetase subunit TsaC/SUA5/YrdC